MKKLLSIILTVCMLFSLVIVPVAVNAEETAKVTLQYLDGTTAEATIDEGKIVYPTLAAEINYDHVWSKDEKKYDPAPETTSENITVYELKSNVLSFENYPVTEIGTGADAAYSEEAYYHKGAIYSEREFNTFVTDEDAYSGTHSMKLRDHNVRLRPSEPANWATSTWKDHYGYNEATQKWERLTGSTAPAFEPYKYAYERYRSNYESGMTIVKRFEKSEIPLEGEYLVTFKYKATENNQEASTLRARLILEQKQDSGELALELGKFTFEKGATDGWQQGSFTIKATAANADTQALGYDQVLDLQWLYGGEGSTGTQYKKEIYIDDIRIVNVEDLVGVSYVSPDGSSEFIEYEVGDTIKYPTTNPGGASNYNKHYVWSATQDTYTQPPTTFTENTTVYWVETDVMKFQHDMPILEMVYDPSKYFGVDFANEGYDDNRSVKIRNYNARTTTKVSADRQYCYYDSISDSYILIPEAELADGYDALVERYGDIFESRPGGIEQANIPVYRYNEAAAPFTDNAKITFKYKFTGKNAGNGVKVYAAIINSGSGNYGSVKYTSQAIVLPTSTSDEWRTVSLYTLIDTNNATMTHQDKKALLVLKFEDGASYANASTFTILVDDVKYETFENTPTVILHNGDEVTKVTDGLVAGGEYTPTAPTAPEGKYFAGWATVPGGHDYVKTLTIPAADSGKSLVVEYYAIFRDIPPFQYGDCDENGVVDATDLALLKLKLANLCEVGLGADCDGNGVIDATDLALLKLKLANLCELGPEQ